MFNFHSNSWLYTESNLLWALINRIKLHQCQHMPYSYLVVGTSLAKPCDRRQTCCWSLGAKWNYAIEVFFASQKSKVVQAKIESSFYKSSTRIHTALEANILSISLKSAPGFSLLCRCPLFLCQPLPFYWIANIKSECNSWTAQCTHIYAQVCKWACMRWACSVRTLLMISTFWLGINCIEHTVCLLNSSIIPSLHLPAIQCVFGPKRDMLT